MKPCPNCEHPMLDCEGVLQPRRGSGDNRYADWYCMSCHYVIWTGASSQTNGR